MCFKEGPTWLCRGALGFQYTQVGFNSTPVSCVLGISLSISCHDSLTCHRNPACCFCTAQKIGDITFVPYHCGLLGLLGQLHLLCPETEQMFPNNELSSNICWNGKERVKFKNTWNQTEVPFLAKVPVPHPYYIFVR